ncbi:MAG: hypothetical protein JRN67_10880, partial [Nitrososphaerota archaeon]|nr:hypothetical protein [Nitrososphaerota archaeon]
AKKAGITPPGLNSPIPHGVRMKLVAAFTIAYKAAHIAADAISLTLLLEKLLYITPHVISEIY